jgi:hypothetical protein
VKVLFFSCEPGGAEVLAPVIKEMQKDNSCEVVVVGYGYAIDRFQKQNINFDIINAINKNDFSLLEQYNPNYIITSATSLPQKDMSEKYLWYNAKQKNIPTMAFLDQWQNYAIRFSGVSEDEYMIYQPDFINCINDIGKKEMLHLGFGGDKLLELGQPYLSTIKDKVKSINTKDIKNTLQLDAEKEIVLFVSEAIEEHFGNRRGYTQYSTIEYLLSNNFIKNRQIILKLHPKDDITKFQQYKNIIFVQNEYTSLEMIALSDYIIGMTSMMLIEAYILGKKVLSIQLNCNEDLLFLTRENYIYQIINSFDPIFEDEFKNSNKFIYQFNKKKFVKLLKRGY